MNIKGLNDAKLLDLYEDWIRLKHYDPHNSYDRMDYSYTEVKQEVLRRLKLNPENEQ